MVLVSDYPMFTPQKQILELIHHNVILNRIKNQPIDTANTIEFYLSLIFHHLKIDSSNLQFQLVDNGSTIYSFENNIGEKCFKLENFRFNELFMIIKPSLFVEIFICILHERKIVLVSPDENQNASII